MSTSRRAFLSGMAAVLAGTSVLKTAPAQPLILRQNAWISVGEGGEFMTLKAALDVAGPGCTVFIMPGHYEMTNDGDVRTIPAEEFFIVEPRT